jgi:hypothetical protein
MRQANVVLGVGVVQLIKLLMFRLRFTFIRHSTVRGHVVRNHSALSQKISPQQIIIINTHLPLVWAVLLIHPKFQGKLLSAQERSSSLGVR